MKLHKKTALFRGILSVSSFLLSISVLAGILLEDNGTMVDETLKTQRTKTITTDDGQLFTAFVPDEIITNGKLDPSKAAKMSNDYNVAVGEEGTVLLKNNKVLPMKGAKKVTALGWWSNKYANVNNWTGAISGENFLKAGLRDKGIELNPVALEAYATKNIGKYPSPGYANNKCWGKVTNEEYYESQSLVNTGTGASTAFNPHEPTVAELEAAKAGFTASLDEYNDVALVCIGRGSAEGADYKAGPDGMHPDADKGARTPLGLTDNERAILELAKEKFDKVVVLVNCTNTMELAEIQNDPKVDAVLYTPTFNQKNVEGLCNVLVGDANPSGGLNNLYASNTLSSPAMMNQGFFRYSNAEDVKIYKTKAEKGENDGRIDTSTLGTNGTDVGYTNYLIEAEGIYVGYRYYETRYYDCVMNQGKASSKAGVYDSTGNWNYSEEVVYGFGYGLSYTDFRREITSVQFVDEGVHAKNHEKYALVTVEVENTGDVAGKTPVQIYGQAPYTEYDKKNGVEKSAIQLLEFGKTGIIQPGKKESVTVKVDLADLASYDGNKAKTYIMDNVGDYYFATGNGAHDALNNILAAQGKTKADGMDSEGYAKAAYKWNYQSPVEGDVDAFTFSVSKNGGKVTNQLDSSQWSYYGDKNTVTYLTRQDWEGTYPKSYTGLTASPTMLKYLNGHYIENKTSSAAELAEVKWDQPTDLKFGDMKFAEFNDYRWEELLDSLSLKETIEFCYKGGRNFAALSIGFPAGNYAENGASKNLAYDTNEGAINPPWLAEGEKAGTTSITLAQPAAMACTFSHELAKTYGKLSGIGGILGERIFLWQPGANTLRTPYNGRSSLYYSEDPVVTGVNAMEACVEAIKYGGIITAKHFFANDQELGRSGIGVFMTEQRAREIEMRAFQIAIESNLYDTAEKAVGLMGLMTGFNKLGAIDLTCHQAVLTNILRGEWGYNGYVVSDLKDDCDLAPQAFLAGLTGYDYRTASDDVDPYLDSQEFKVDADLQKAMKDMVKRELWCFANSSLMNKVNSSSYSVWNLTWWRATYISTIAVSGVITLAAAALYVVSMLGKQEG
ncbi:MAG: glycoside hydrolase family 3 C-terminal domain-containing protein [Clostridia bacterium]|nr:glycoside hydrolase family 3 C-terminal domain-containing protein [Clostridia bacterium]